MTPKHFTSLKNLHIFLSKILQQSVFAWNLDFLWALNVLETCNISLIVDVFCE